jgi:hypothetical protein
MSRAFGWLADENDASGPVIRVLLEKKGGAMENGYIYFLCIYTMQIRHDARYGFGSVDR